MSTPAPQLAPKPPHVPDELVVDLDIYHPPHAGTDLRVVWKRLQEGPELVWTPHNGGHWIATRGEDIEYIQKNHDPFSMQRILLPDDPKRPTLLPIEMDPPDHAKYRAVLNRFFTPQAVQPLQEAARALTIELIDGFKGRGRCEFVADFSMKLPITIFMRMVDQPMDDLDQLLEWTRMSIRPKDAEERTRANFEMIDYLTAAIEARRAKPGADLLSGVVFSQIDGETIPMEALLGILSTVMFGGLDTVASSLGFGVNFLARNPDKRHELIARPELIANAGDELLRMFAPSSTARLITRDLTYKGVALRSGDMIYVRNLLHGMDEGVFPNALEADWERPAVRVSYAAFGNGPHRCPGVNLARSEMQIFLEEWLRRIPDFAPDPLDPPSMEYGMVDTFLRLPLVWDPATTR
jgi:cytochrome P450